MSYLVVFVPAGLLLVLSFPLAVWTDKFGAVSKLSSHLNVASSADRTVCLCFADDTLDMWWIKTAVFPYVLDLSRVFRLFCPLDFVVGLIKKDHTLD